MAKKVATQLTPKVIAARKNGALGGKARAENFKNKKNKLKQWSSKGGKRCLEMYGKDFFSSIRKKKKTEGRYKTPKIAYV